MRLILLFLTVTSFTILVESRDLNNGYLKSSRALKQGGCLAQNVHIPYFDADMAASYPNLKKRIYEIINLNKRSMKVFENREGCLPTLSNGYLEYRLNPQIADKFRIVALSNFAIFYFTADHYVSFYRVPDVNFFTLGSQTG